MPRRFVLDQSVPEPIVDGLLTRAPPMLATLDDWAGLQALHADDAKWDGLIATDAKILSLPRELAVRRQARLTLVVAGPVAALAA